MKNEYFVYIGPTIRGLIQSGTIYKGSLKMALKQAEEAILKVPVIKNLIVSGETLSTARIKVKTQGNMLYECYQKVLKAVSSK